MTDMTPGPVVEAATPGSGGAGVRESGEGSKTPVPPLAPNPHRLSQVIAVLEETPVMLRHKRERLGLSQRAAAKQIGLSFSTVSRIENNEFAEVKSYLAVLRWLR